MSVSSPRVALTNSFFCDNGTDQGGAAGAAVSIGSGRLLAQGNVFALGLATYDGGGLLVSAESGELRIFNNDFLGNSAYPGAGLTLQGGYRDADIVGNLFASQDRGAGLWSEELLPLDALRYNAWYANDGGDVGGALGAPGTDDLSLDSSPLVGWPATDCGSIDFALVAGSVLQDAGDPGSTDSDGSRSDIGATGGVPDVTWIDGADPDFVGETDAEQPSEDPPPGDGALPVPQAANSPAEAQAAPSEGPTSPVSGCATAPGEARLWWAAFLLFLMPCGQRAAKR